MSWKVLSGVVVVLLLCAPLGLAAQERESRSPAEASVLESLGSVWSGIAAWLGSHLAAALDGRCAIDPDGCPRGAVAPPEPPPSSIVDGRCTVDPNGCPGGE